MGGLLNNSVKMENGYKLASLATQQKHTVPYDGKTNERRCCELG